VITITQKAHWRQVATNTWVLRLRLASLGGWYSFNSPNYNIELARIIKVNNKYEVLVNGHRPIYYGKDKTRKDPFKSLLAAKRWIVETFFDWNAQGKIDAAKEKRLQKRRRRSEARRRRLEAKQIEIEAKAAELLKEKKRKQRIERKKLKKLKEEKKHGYLVDLIL